MKKETITCGIVLLLIVSGYLCFFRNSPKSAVMHFAPARSANVSVARRPEVAAPTLITDPSKVDSNSTPDPQTQAAGKLLVKLLAERGIKPDPPAAAILASAVAANDNIQIVRAFDDVTYRHQMADAIPALREYVNNANPVARYMAASDLLVVGDDSGVQTLIELMKSSEPIEGHGEDIRIRSAEVLSQYRQRRALPEIVDLYKRLKATDTDSVFYAEGALDDLNVPLPNVDQLSFRPLKGALIAYGKAGPKRFIPQIASLFAKTSQPSLKAAAAWALATLNGDRGAIDYLVQETRRQMEDPARTKGFRPGPIPIANTELEEWLKYVGTIRDPAAKQLLEDALDDRYVGVVAVAVTNLLYNQGGSARALQKLATELTHTGTASTMPGDFVFEITSKFLDNPIIQAAREQVSRRGQNRDWEQYALEHRTWPSYNWIWRYVLMLNDERPGKLPTR